MTAAAKPRPKVPPLARRFQAVLVGVGGQGVLTAANIFGEAAHRAGHAVTTGQLHGMSQRGGTVECSVLIGEGESSFIIGHADLVVGFEPLEVARALPVIGPDTWVVVNQATILPFVLTEAGYPPLDELLGPARDRARAVVVVDGARACQEAGAPRTLNVAMLGAVAGLGILPFDGAHLGETAVSLLSDRFRESNLRAFEVGRQLTTTESPHG